jgi:hypothetical protein
MQCDSVWPARGSQTFAECWGNILFKYVAVVFVWCKWNNYPCCEEIRTMDSRSWATSCIHKAMLKFRTTEEHISWACVRQWVVLWGLYKYIAFSANEREMGSISGGAVFAPVRGWKCRINWRLITGLAYWVWFFICMKCGWYRQRFWWLFV